jgi:hypothetical protein
VCEILKKGGASGDNPKTSIHVHLDGGSTGTLRSSKTKPKTEARVFAVSNKLKVQVNTLHMVRALKSNQRPVLGTNIFTVDNIYYYSLAELTREPRMNYTYYWLEGADRYHWLRNVFYFYTKFSDVMESIVSNSRRTGNSYCLPLGLSYDLEAIESCKTMEDIENVWYKGRGRGGHYDDSRYHNVNLHSYWDRHGTVEIRSHGGTTDPGKILLWVRLHQLIVDKLEDMTLEQVKELGNEPKDFVNFLDDKLLQDYVKRLLGYYSGIKIK